MKSFWIRKLLQVLAIGLALGIGTYLVVCRSPASNGLTGGESGNEGPPESCAALQREIQQIDIYMTTSKSGPAPADLERRDRMQSRYDAHCK